MSSFEVKSYQLQIEEHPNADALEIAKVGEYRSIVRKGQYINGDWAIYIPEAAIVPLDLLRKMGLTKDKDGTEVGSLAGPEGNRVKAIKLRGILSQGLCYGKNGIFATDLDTNWADALGITKWEPPIPIHLAGEVEACPKIRGYTDIENIKKYPDVLEKDEFVYAFEKGHGTCCIASLIEDEFFVTSKGLGGKGLVLKQSETNTYWRAALANDLENLCRDIRAYFGEVGDQAKEVTLFGEILGVQDLMYGLSKGDTKYYIFDIRIDGRYLDISEWNWLSGVERMPMLYAGPFDMETIKELSEGTTRINGTNHHIREGVVVRPRLERSDDTIGRVILKSVGEGYLTRKGEATEYE